MSAPGLWRGKAYTAPLLCASTGLAVTLVFDRVTPLYELIYGGCRGRWGAAGGTLAVALWADAVSAYRFRLAYQGERQQLRQRLTLQKELVVDNSFDGVISMREERYLSTKREGMGLASIQSVAEKYGGLADFSVAGTTFRASVMVPLSGIAQPQRAACD